MNTKTVTSLRLYTVYNLNLELRLQAREASHNTKTTFVSIVSSWQQRAQAWGVLQLSFMDWKAAVDGVHLLQHVEELSE